MKHPLGTTILALAACTNSAWAGPSLCARDETVFFNCPVRGGKLVSLCGRLPDAEARAAGTEEWLQYRFGRPGAVELSHPGTRKDSLSSFKGGHVLSHLANGEISSDSVAFVRGGIGYQVESTVPESQKLFQGVSIGNPRKFDLPAPAQARAAYPDAVIPCTSKADTRHLFDLVRALQY